ncbi:MAG: preprotein translocase subunit YajC [Clostridiales bacterium]|nr:preprotein translocase subunit YajC [Clostridiales bacterium]
MLPISLLAAEEGGNQPSGTIWIFVALLVVLVVVLLVVPMFTNKKRAKEANELHNSLKPGDLIKTVGGVIGTIVEIRQVSPADKEMVIETGVGDNKTTMVFDIQALYQVLSHVESPEAAEPAEENAEEVSDTLAAPENEPEPIADTVETPVEAAAPAVEETAAVAEDAPASEPVETEPEAAAPKAKSTKKVPIKKSTKK